MPDLTRDPLGFILQCELNPHDRNHPATPQAAEILQEEIKRQKNRLAALEAALANVNGRMTATA